MTVSLAITQVYSYLLEIVLVSVSDIIKKKREKK